VCQSVTRCDEIDDRMTYLVSSVIDFSMYGVSACFSDMADKQTSLIRTGPVCLYTTSKYVTG